MFWMIIWMFYIGKNTVKSLLDKYDIEYGIAESDLIFGVYVKEDNSFDIIYDDGDFLVFKYNR